MINQLVLFSMADTPIVELMNRRFVKESTVGDVPCLLRATTRNGYATKGPWDRLPACHFQIDRLEASIPRT